MSIEFRCRNVAGYDKTSSKYLKCNQRLRVASKLAGKIINCPKCSQEVEVPFETQGSSDTQRGQQKKSYSNKQRGGQLVVHELDSKRNIMEMDFNQDAATAHPAPNESIKNRCPKCGGIFSDDGICTLCNFVEPVSKARRDIEERKLTKPAGFQLWLTQLSSDGNSMTLMGYVMFIAASIFGLILIAGGIVSTSFWGVVLAVATGFMLVLLWSIFLKTRQLAKDPAASLGALGPFWNLLLFGARYFDWQKYDSRYSGRKIIDLRNKPVSDAELPAVEGFKKTQVLDLEGCDITDKGLLPLYGHQHLHCLVLRKTKVTRTAVAMLQQAIPRLWIWQ